MLPQRGALTSPRTLIRGCKSLRVADPAALVQTREQCAGSSIRAGELATAQWNSAEREVAGGASATVGADSSEVVPPGRAALSGLLSAAGLPCQKPTSTLSDRQPPSPVILRASRASGKDLGGGKLPPSQILQVARAPTRMTMAAASRTLGRASTAPSPCHWFSRGAVTAPRKDLRLLRMDLWLLYGAVTALHKEPRFLGVDLRFTRIRSRFTRVPSRFTRV